MLQLIKSKLSSRYLAAITSVTNKQVAFLDVGLDDLLEGEHKLRPRVVHLLADLQRLSLGVEHAQALNFNANAKS